ncbi:hypothetical protein SKAU_G00212430 [Synaphobranchus kaupii]|uniref:Uncharacterized protein n=1 Tax=Synaphobranchus kaupii TaxID=118154 RepID=A0A9Q1F9Q1_SYNKA|nr:hypothetical protein SKAU_G00212430 [Synaphobranchus kaupii]
MDIHHKNQTSREERDEPAEKLKTPVPGDPEKDMANTDDYEKVVMEAPVWVIETIPSAPECEDIKLCGEQ